MTTFHESVKKLILLLFLSTKVVINYSKKSAKLKNDLI